MKIREENARKQQKAKEERILIRKRKQEEKLIKQKEKQKKQEEKRAQNKNNYKKTICTGTCAPAGPLELYRQKANIQLFLCTTTLHYEKHFWHNHTKWKLFLNFATTEGI